MVVHYQQMLDVHFSKINCTCNCIHILLRALYYFLYYTQYNKYTMICILKSTIVSIQNKNSKIHTFVS